MAEFGAAVFDAQVLESSLEHILALLDRTASQDERLPNASKLYGPDSKATLRELIQALRKRIELPQEISDQLEAVIKVRNSLVHGHFKPESRLSKTHTTEGLTALISELRAIRASLKDANKFTDGILDTLLRRYNTSIEDLRIHANAMYATAQMQEFRGTRH